MGARSLVQRSRKSGFGETQDVFRVHCLAEIEKEREKLGLGLGFFRFLADVKDEHFFFFFWLSAKSDREDGFSNRAEGTGRCKRDRTWEWIGLKGWPSLFFFFWGRSQVAGPHGT